MHPFIALALLGLGWLAWLSKAVGGPGLLAPAFGNAWLFRDGQLFLLSNFLVFYSTKAPRAFQRMVLRPRGWCSTREAVKRGEYVAALQVMFILLVFVAIMRDSGDARALFDDGYWGPWTTYLLYPFAVLNSLAIRYLSLNLPVASPAAPKYGPDGTEIVAIAAGQLAIYEDTLSAQPPQPFRGPQLIDRPQGVSVFVLNQDEIISVREIKAPAGQLEVETSVKVTVANDLSQVNYTQLCVPGGESWRAWVFDETSARDSLVRLIQSSEAYLKFKLAIEMNSQLLKYVERDHQGVTSEFEMKVAMAEREVQAILCSEMVLPSIPLFGGLLQMRIIVHRAVWAHEQRARYEALKQEVIAARMRRHEQYQQMLSRYAEVATKLGPNHSSARRLWQEAERLGYSSGPSAAAGVDTSAGSEYDDLIHHLLADADPRADPVATARYAMDQLVVQVPEGSSYRELVRTEKNEILEQWQLWYSTHKWCDAREALLSLLCNFTDRGWIIRQRDSSR